MESTLKACWILPDSPEEQHQLQTCLHVGNVPAVSSHAYTIPTTSARDHHCHGDGGDCGLASGRASQMGGKDEKMAKPKQIERIKQATKGPTGFI